MTQQPLDILMTEHGITNAQVVKASTEQLSFKMLQKGRQGERVSPKIQEKILNALLRVKPDLKVRRRELFMYEAPEDVIAQIKNAISWVQTRKISYPEYVDALDKAGIFRYAVDVAKHRTTFYGTGGEAHIEEGPAVSHSAPGAFDDVALKAAIADAQKGVIDYPVFLKRIYAAGIAGYEVNIRERYIRYKGLAQAYKERIPAVGELPAALAKTDAASRAKGGKAKAAKKNTGRARIKKTGKFVIKHRTKKRQFIRKK